MYTDTYTAFLPPELLAMAETPVMQRLLRVGMHCGCEYTAYPIYRDAVAPYSRYTHSLGTAAIVWHFTHDLKQSVAGLLHDIATPAFAHVVDFLNGDHMRQESTESRTRMMIASSPELMALLDKSGLTLDDVDDYHRYPIADNDSPRLSADRLEYTLGNAHLVFHCPKAELKRIFDDIFVGKNEENVDELCFAHAEIADIFTQLSLRQSEWFVSDEDRFSMQALADLLREARQRNVLTVDDLYLDEPHVIALLLSDPVPRRALAGLSPHNRYAVRRAKAGGYLRRQDRRQKAQHRPAGADERRPSALHHSQCGLCIKARRLLLG